MHASRRPCRAIVVDDNFDAADSLAKMLTLMGCEARFFTDPQLALEAMRADAPDIAFLDLAMPRLNGLQLARELRADYPVERLHLVALTAYGDDRSREQTRAAGFDAHLLKPATPELVKATLEQFHLPLRPQAHSPP